MEIPFLLSVASQPGLRAALIKFAEVEFERVRHRNMNSGEFQAKRIAELELQAANLAKAIAKDGNLDACVAQSAAVDADLHGARMEAERLLQQSREANEFVSYSDQARTCSEPDDIEAGFASVEAVTFSYVSQHTGKSRNGYRRC